MANWPAKQTAAVPYATKLVLELVVTGYVTPFLGAFITHTQGFVCWYISISCQITWYKLCQEVVRVPTWFTAFQPGPLFSPVFGLYNMLIR